tara:strand:+ start:483 stop:662 length:180 start_codon:yes stop_codon:yes gene_type:complete
MYNMNEIKRLFEGTVNEKAINSLSDQMAEELNSILGDGDNYESKNKRNKNKQKKGNKIG